MIHVSFFSKRAHKKTVTFIIARVVKMLGTNQPPLVALIGLDPLQPQAGSLCFVFRPCVLSAILDFITASFGDLFLNKKNTKFILKINVFCGFWKMICASTSCIRYVVCGKLHSIDSLMLAFLSMYVLFDHTIYIYMYMFILACIHISLYIYICIYVNV